MGVDESGDPMHLPDRRSSEEEVAHLRVMLTSTARIPVDKPARADYMVRGVERRVTELSVHRVIFYYPGGRPDEA